MQGKEAQSKIKDTYKIYDHLNAATDSWYKRKSSNQKIFVSCALYEYDA
jgi:hypothetical protein